MDKMLELEQTQRLRDVTQSVIVCGQMEKEGHAQIVKQVISEMEILGKIWAKYLDNRLVLLKKELKIP